MDNPRKSQDFQARSFIRRPAKNYIVSYSKLFSQIKSGLRILVPVPYLYSILKSLQDYGWQWDGVTTINRVPDRFWRPKIHEDVLGKLVKSWDYSQLMAPFPRYRTNLHCPFTILFEVFTIYISVSFPPTETESRYNLICVEYLTNWPIAKVTKYYTASTALTFSRNTSCSPFVRWALSLVTIRLS